MSNNSIELHDKFLFTLEWLLAVTKRYSTQVHFDLVHIHFSNPGVLGDTFGAQEAARRLDEILDILRNAFRKTDLVARDGVDFWVLVPYTPSDGRIADKVRDVIDATSRTGLQIVERDISFFSLPFETPELHPNCSASEFLAYLKKNHIRLARQEVSISPEE